MNSRRPECHRETPSTELRRSCSRNKQVTALSRTERAPSSNIQYWHADIFEVGRASTTATVECENSDLELSLLRYWQPVENVAKSRRGVVKLANNSVSCSQRLSETHEPNLIQSSRNRQPSRRNVPSSVVMKIQYGGGLRIEFRKISISLVWMKIFPLN